MVRLKDRDDLKDLKGHLGAGFESARLVTLQASFLAAVNEAEHPKVTDALKTLYKAAHNLRHHEHAFNARARQPQAAPSLMQHLRDPAHFSALREFNAAKESLLDIHPQASRAIINTIEKDIHPAAPRSSY